MTHLSLCSKVFIALFSVLLTAHAGETPQHVRPGDAAVSGAFLKPYTNAWTYTQTKASGEVKELGLWTDKLTLVRRDNEQQIRREQKFSTPQGERILINRARHSDLAARAFEIRTTEGQVLQAVTFTDKGIQVKQAGVGEALTIDLNEPVFDWYLYGVLVVAFPLTDHYEATFPALNPLLGPVTRNLKVLGREKVPGPKGLTPCWKVACDDGLTFWVSKQAPYIYRLVREVANGDRFTWELAKGSVKTDR